jgi:hypothetical protein
MRVAIVAAAGVDEVAAQADQRPVLARHVQLHALWNDLEPRLTCDWAWSSSARPFDDLPWSSPARAADASTSDSPAHAISVTRPVLRR